MCSIADRIEASLAQADGEEVHRCRLTARGAFYEGIDHGSESSSAALPEDYSATDEAVADPFDEAMFLYQQAIVLIEGGGDGSDGSVGNGGSSGAPESIEKDVKALLQCCVDALGEGISDGDKAAAAGEMLCSCHVLLGRLVEWTSPGAAREHFEAALRASPHDAEAQLQLGRHRYLRATSSDDLGEAEALLRSAIASSDQEGRDSGDEENDHNDEEEEEEENDDGEGASTFVEAQRLLARLLLLRGSGSGAEEAQAASVVEEAHGLLRSMGYTHTFSRDVLSRDFLCSDPPPSERDHSSISNGSSGGGSRGGQRMHDKVSVFDGALPSRLAGPLRRALAAGAPFWEEHAYGSPRTGFFSYQHRLDGPDHGSDGDNDNGNGDDDGNDDDDDDDDDLNGEDFPPPRLLERVLRHVRSVAASNNPAVAERARFAEWWAHRRPHHNGHKLHYDYTVESRAPTKLKRPRDDNRPGDWGGAATAAKQGRAEELEIEDEGQEEQAEEEEEEEAVVKHPIVSTVCYLTAPCGGPTLVTDQTMFPQQEEEDDDDDDDYATGRGGGDGGDGGGTGRGSSRGYDGGGTGSEAAAAVGAARGWACAPRQNRMLVFDGTLLHCVLPGAGPSPPASAPEQRWGEGRAEENERAGEDGAAAAAAAAAAALGGGEGRTAAAAGRGAAAASEGRGASKNEADPAEPEHLRRKKRKLGTREGDDGGDAWQEPCRLTFMVALWEEDPRAPPFPKKNKKKKKKKKKNENKEEEEEEEEEEMNDAPAALRWPATFADDQAQDDDDDDDAMDDGDGKARAGDSSSSSSCAHQNHGAVVEIPRVWEPLLSGGDGPPLIPGGGGVQRPSDQQQQQQEEALASRRRLDLLSSTCFTDFAALTSGLLVGSSAKGGCSLNWWEKHRA